MKNRLASLLLLLLLTLPSPAQTVRLDITASPPEAVIVVDREIRGTGQASLELTPGRHLIRVSAGENWVPQTRELELSAPTRLNIRLEAGAVKLLEKARALLHLGQAAEAIPGLEKAARQPRQVQPWFYLGVAYWEVDDRERALAAFRQYARFQPDYPELYLFLGDLHERAGRTAQACTAWKSALILRPELREALQGLPKPSDAAIAALGQPQQARARLRLAQLHMLKGNLRQANDWLGRVIAQVYPDWRERDWSAVEVPGADPPPNPELPVEGPQR